MIRSLLIASAFLLGALPALAASAVAVPTPTGKISITGDSFVVDDATHQATFTGSVFVDHPEIKVNADKVVAFYGQGGASNITNFEATGNVKIVTKDQTATGEKAVFDPKTHVLRLTGNVIVVGSTGRVRAPELVVDLKKKTSEFSSGKTGGRVTGVFTSQ
ncbi:MAG TPA: LptA/OstA family protein [Devosiaceae bacterium]|jgi:lipopolysaccharide export system protein LptA|nr:LptA/OstA family protein [Devosiaceae bacterium]